MRKLALCLAALALLAPPAVAQMKPSMIPQAIPSNLGMYGRPDAGPKVVYDQASHERITYMIDRMTGGFIEGENLDTHKSWRASIRSDGSMSGTDLDGNPWKYDHRTRLYTDLSTGKTCEKSSLRRVCAP